MDRKIIAVDFDGTLCMNQGAVNWPYLGQPNKELVETLKKLQEEGHALILWTCREGELLDLGDKYGFLKKTGSWYEYKGNKIGNGREACKAYLREHPEIASEIDSGVREAVRKEAAPEEEADEDGVIA